MLGLEIPRPHSLQLRFMVNTQEKNYFKHCTSTRPRTLDELEERILNEIDEINRDPDLIKKCHLSV